MNRTSRVAALLLGGVLVITNSTSAAIIVDKSPDLGPVWSPLAAPTFVYANSFVFGGTSGTLMDTVGVYMLNFSGTAGTPFRFEVYADTGSNAPDPTTVLGVTGYQTFASSTLTLVTNTLGAAISLTNSVRYWIAASTVGQTPDGGYVVGGHTQNSIYSDNGTFWYSNDPAGLIFDGTELTPEMAIYASGPDTPPPQGVPEPASLTIWGLGLLACAAGIRRRKVVA
jgi:hypothetical protein